MTMPNERTRALRWAGEFLREAKRHEGLPEELRKQIPFILRHYPSALDIEHQARHGDDVSGIGGRWLGPEEQR
ncbi:MAG: hypothetical protein I8H91_02770 [Burkholderiales bacterium]|nr:hypothetical protein [Burkholderiales bacterium]